MQYLYVLSQRETEREIAPFFIGYELTYCFYVHGFRRDTLFMMKTMVMMKMEIMLPIFVTFYIQKVPSVINTWEMMVDTT